MRFDEGWQRFGGERDADRLPHESAIRLRHDPARIYAGVLLFAKKVCALAHPGSGRSPMSLTGRGCVKT